MNTLPQRHTLQICRKKYKKQTSSTDAGLQTAQYDALGLPTTVTDALGQATQITRDLLGRPTAITYADDGNTATPTVLAAFTAFFESLWSPITGTTAAAEKSGMSYVYNEDGTLIADTLTGGATTT